MEIVLRVKRLSSDAPIDLIQLQKKPKTFEDYFSTLSLNSKITLKRSTVSPSKILNADTPKPFESISESRRKEARNLLIKKFRNQVISQDDLIYYNGVPLRTSQAEPNDDIIIDEYYMCEENEDLGQCPNNIGLELVDSSEDEEFDSEDSNCEDNYKNDYPDEESSGDSNSYKYDKSYDSEDYEDYEVY